MAFGGGTFTDTATNNKMPGAYLNFVSAARNANASERGIVTMPLELEWGPEGVFEVTSENFKDNCFNIFALNYDDDKLKGIRDLFKHANVAYLYRLNSDGDKAKSLVGTAKCAGTRGNDITVLISANVDNDSAVDVVTKIGNKIVDKQTVESLDSTATTSLLSDNDFIVWNDDVELVKGTTAPFTGGTNKTVTSERYKAYLDEIEKYHFNVMGITSTDATVQNMCISFCNRLRDNLGIKFQLVLYNSTTSNYEGVINVNSTIKGEEGEESSLVYWVTGAEAEAGVSDSLDAMIYDGEYDINTNMTQLSLINAKNSGKFVFHSTNGVVRVLSDINSLTSFTDEKGEIFSDNKTIRVIDTWANRIAELFNTKYLGKVPNDGAGRSALWSDICSIANEFSDARAIEDFDGKEDVKISEGKDKNSVIVTAKLKITGTMKYLFVTTEVE